MFVQHFLERIRAAKLRVGKRLAGIPQILFVFERFDPSEIRQWKKSRYGLAVSVNDQPLTAMFGSPQQVGKLILGFRDCQVTHP